MLLISLLISLMTLVPLRGFAALPTPISHSYDVDVSDDGMFIHTHLNGVSVVGLGARHPLRLASAAPVVSIDWNVGNSDRSALRLSGKRKRGTIALESNSRLCNIVCADESVFGVRAGVRGRLIQVNARLSEQASMIQNRERADDDAFIAVIQRFAQHPAAFSAKKSANGPPAQARISVISPVSA